MSVQPNCPEIECWLALLADAVPEPQWEDCERHLESCPTCQERLHRAEDCGEALRQLAREVGDPTLRPADPLLTQCLDRLHGTTVPDLAAPIEPPDLYFLRPTDRPEALGMLGAYEVREVIGQGGMGVVLKAFDPALNRLVAIKVLAAAVAGSAVARQRFTREAQAAAAVVHDHVVTVHGVHQEDGLPYLVMQYVAGESLQDRLDRMGPLDTVEVLRIGLQTASGLAAAHAQGLIHRDVKPANLLLASPLRPIGPMGPIDLMGLPGAEEDLCVKITDFGLARMIDDVPLTRDGVVAGTPEYMAPEQARGETVDHRADLFSLGSVLYACCTGAPPFRGSTAMAVLLKLGAETPRPIRALNPDVPAWLEALIGRLMAKDPADRFSSAAEVAGLLEGCLDHLRQRDVPAPELPALPPNDPVGAGRRSRKVVRLRRFVWPCVLLLAVTCAAAWFLGGPAGPAPQAAKREEFSCSLKRPPTDPNEFSFLGPDAEKCIAFDRDGLRITLPAGVPGERPITGVAPHLAVRGDFEITVRYEILHQPSPNDTGPTGTRFTLEVVLNTPAKNVATFSRKVGPKQGPQMVAWSVVTAASGKEQSQARLFPARGNTGRLRLSRSGTVLSYFVAEGDSPEFRLLHQRPFGAENVREFRLCGSTGGEKASMDVRFTDLLVRGEALTRLPPQLRPVEAPQTPVPGELPEHVHFDFRAGLEGQPLHLMGPDAASLAQVDAQGLRFNLPAERRDTDVVGVESPLRLRGDFEATLGYELLAVPQQPPPLGVGVRFILSFDTPAAIRASASRTHKPAGPRVGGFLIVKGADGKEHYHGQDVSAREPNGKLRIARIGDNLIFSIAEGTGSFKIVSTSKGPTGDVMRVHVHAYTGWQPFSLDVRVLDLDVRAAQMPNKPVAPSSTAAPAEPPGPSAKRSWLPAGAILGAAAVLAFALAWRLCRRRPTPAADPRKAESPDAEHLSVRCAECGKTLKVKATLAGKKVKCPGCGRAVLVPGIKTAGSESTSLPLPPPRGRE